MTIAPSKLCQPTTPATLPEQRCRAGFTCHLTPAACRLLLASCNLPPPFPRTCPVLASYLPRCYSTYPHTPKPYIF
jgi:hypothetical protein